MAKMGMASAGLTKVALMWLTDAQCRVSWRMMRVATFGCLVMLIRHLWSAWIWIWIMIMARQRGEDGGRNHGDKTSGGRSCEITSSIA